MTIVLGISTTSITEEDLQYIAFRLFRATEGTPISLTFLGVSRGSKARGFNATLHALKATAQAAANQFDDVTVHYLNDALANVEESG